MSRFLSTFEINYGPAGIIVLNTLIIYGTSGKRDAIHESSS